MTSTTTATPENVALADRADRMLELLRARDPGDADAQASAMVMAGLKMLQDLRGSAAVRAVLEKVGPLLRDDDKGTPSTVRGPLRDRAGQLIDDLMGRDVDGAGFEARAMLAAGGTVLQDRLGTEAVLDALARLTVAAQERGRLLAAPEAGQATAALQVEPIRTAHVHAHDLAVFVLTNLRALEETEAEGQARAVIAGASAYLVEARGATYASAVVDGLMINATRHIETCGAGPRRADATLH